MASTQQNTPKVERFEKLGVFYLGKLENSEAAPELLLYDSKDLTTHAVCLGMTGSGKTGLCISLLEEAALDGIPAIAIDLKGDIANLLLSFAGFSRFPLRMRVIRNGLPNPLKIIHRKRGQRLAGWRCRSASQLSSPSGSALPLPGDAG
jgi:DNA helicase HerA-like ATPase